MTKRHPRCNLIEKPNEYSDDRGADVGIKVQAAAIIEFSDGKF
jgi:hypothetical protein